MNIVFQQYEERLNRLGRHPNTKRNFVRAAECLEDWMQEQGLSFDALTPEILEEYFSSSPLAASTKKLHLVEIRAAVRYAHRRGLILRDPTLDVQLGRTPDKEIRVLSSEQLRYLLAWVDSEPEHTMLMVAIYTGMRAFEIAKLDWASVDLGQSSIQVVGKGGKLRIVPIHPALGEVLADLPFKKGPVVVGENGGTGTHSLVNRLKKVSGRSGISVNFHDFRRTVASSLDANGVEEGVIYRIMGWATQSIFDKHYRNVAGKRLQEAILRLYADNPVGS